MDKDQAQQGNQDLQRYEYELSLLNMQNSLEMIKNTNKVVHDFRKAKLNNMLLCREQDLKFNEQIKSGEQNGK